MADDDKSTVWHGSALYSGAIRASIASNDLEDMKKMVERAEKWQADCGDIRGALDVLKGEIAKSQAKS